MDKYMRKTMFRPCLGIAIITAILCLCLCGSGFAKSTTSASSNTPKPNIIKFIPKQTNMMSLAGKPDTDLVEFSGGRRMKVGDIRRFNTLAQKMRAAVPGSRIPMAFKIKPDFANVKTRIDTRQDLAAVLKRPNADTVQIGSSQPVTISQIKFVQPYVEKKLGHKLNDISQRPNLSGPATGINQGTTKEQWIDILKKPDKTVLQAPNGKRINVADLKNGMKLLMDQKALGIQKKSGPVMPPKQINKGGSNENK